MTAARRPLRTDVVPELCIDGAAAAIDFYGEAFGVEEVFRQAVDDGRIIHAKASFDGSVVFLTDD
ncbi:MAG TPA: VOC family protein, partial [Acidobacteria bacterium]|nr:VOC family protein [Acidobacteriota bacterium]